MTAYPHPMTSTGMLPERSAVFLGRQPILDRNRQVVAYELLYRCATANEAGVTDDLAATVQVIRNAFGRLGIHTVLGSRRGFINMDEEALMGKLVDSLPRDQVVLELLETVTVSDRLVRRCAELKARGFRLALDDFSCYSEAYNPLLEIVDIVKIDILLVEDASLSRLVQRLKLFPAKLLAEKVDTVERARRCMSLGFDLFQGYLFGRPAVMAA